MDIGRHAKLTKQTNIVNMFKTTYSTDATTKFPLTAIRRVVPSVKATKSSDIR